MSFLFLSYARDGLEKASVIASKLAAAGVDVFWDQRIRFGRDFRRDIDERLRAAACVLVLWSEASKGSDWVTYEAEAGLERRVLLETLLENIKPPPPFGKRSNLANLASWRGSANSGLLSPLVATVNERVSPFLRGRDDFGLNAPRQNEQVTDSHLTLIHTCWRKTDLDGRFDGLAAYRWDIALFGSKPALDRVRSVTYLLHPAYEVPNAKPSSSAVEVRSGPRARRNCFLLKQVANGHSLVRAHVNVVGQPEPVVLSRYINLFDSSHKIAEYRV